MKTRYFNGYTKNIPRKNRVYDYRCDKILAAFFNICSARELPFFFYQNPNFKFMNNINRTEEVNLPFDPNFIHRLTAMLSDGIERHFKRVQNLTMTPYLLFFNGNSVHFLVSGCLQTETEENFASFEFSRNTDKHI